MLYLTKIRNAESEFTENEQKIADFLRANVSELKSVSSRKMAKRSGETSNRNMDASLSR